MATFTIRIYNFNNKQDILVNDFDAYLTNTHKIPISELLKDYNVILTEQDHILDTKNILTLNSNVTHINKYLLIINENHFNRIDNSDEIVSEQEQEQEQESITPKSFDKYYNLLKKHPTLIPFLYILQNNSSMLDNIIYYLKSTNDKTIYNIINNNQKEIVEMLEEFPNFMENYLSYVNNSINSNLSNVNNSNLNSSNNFEFIIDFVNNSINNITTNITNNSNTNSNTHIVEELENLFPDVPNENITELLDVFLTDNNITY